MWGGWLEFTLTYNGLLSGLLYGLYLPVDRFGVKSRQLATLRFASLTMLRLNSFLNNLMNAFLITSAFGLLVFSKQAKPSSLHQLILPFLYISPTLWRIQRVSELPIVTAKSLSPSFFIHTSVPPKRRDFCECIMVFVLLMMIVTKHFLVIISSFQ